MNSHAGLDRSGEMSDTRSSSSFAGRDVAYWPPTGRDEGFPQHGWSNEIALKRGRRGQAGATPVTLDIGREGFVSTLGVLARFDETHPEHGACVDFEALLVNEGQRTSISKPIARM